MPSRAAAQSEADLPAFDPATLPPIESITATSDIRAFLAPGVPEELTRAALRRAWVTDPTIRDFIGLAENQWDFTKPDSVPGFGSLELTPELRRMVASLVGDAPGANHAARGTLDAERAEQIAEMSGGTGDRPRGLWHPVRAMPLPNDHGTHRPRYVRGRPRRVQFKSFRKTTIMMLQRNKSIGEAEWKSTICPSQAWRGRTKVVLRP